MEIEWRACSAIQREAFRRGLQYPLLRVRLERKQGTRHFLIDFDEDDSIDRQRDIVEEVGGYDFDLVMDKETHEALLSAKMIVGPEGGLKVLMEDDKEDPNEVHSQG